MDNAAKRSPILEIATNPSTLMKWAQGPEAADMVVGFEAEMLIRGLAWPDDDGGTEDRDADEPMPPGYEGFDSAIDDWFANGNDFHESASLRRALRRLDREYLDYVNDRWNEERYSDKWRDRIREVLAEELGVDEDDPQVDENIDLDTSTYRDVKREIKDEFANDDDTWGSYLQMEGLSNMSDFAEAYNLDWPYSRAASGRTPEDLEADFVTKTGYSCTVNDSYHGGRPKNTFVMEPDSSLSGKDGYGGLELISPPMPLASALQAIDRVFDWMESIGAETGWRPSTGFHIGVSMQGRGVENVDQLKLILMMGDEHVLRQFGRERLSRYAASSLAHIRDNLSQPGFNIEAELSKFRSFLDIQAAKDLSAVATGGMRRENSINIRPSMNYIEFRSPGGDYLKQRDEIKVTVLRFARALSIAANPEAEKKEYAKKLYQLLTSSVDRKDNAIEAFAAYSSGLMSREDLRTTIEAYRQKRDGMPGKGDRRWNITDERTGKVVGSVFSDDAQLTDKVRAFAQRNNLDYNRLNASRPGQEKKTVTYRVSQNYGRGERFDIDARSPEEALKYAKSRWGATGRPDTDFTVINRYS